MFRKIISIIFLGFIFLFFSSKTYAAECQLRTDPSPLIGGKFNTLKLTYTLSEEAKNLRKQYPDAGKFQFSFPSFTSIHRPNTCGLKDATIENANGDEWSLTLVKDGINLDPCTNYLFSTGEKLVELVWNVGSYYGICNPTAFWVIQEQPTCTAAVSHDGIGDVNSQWNIVLTNVNFIRDYKHIVYKFDHQAPAPVVFNQDEYNRNNQFNIPIPQRFITAGNHRFTIHPAKEIGGVWEPSIIMCQYGPFTIGARDTPAPSLPPPNDDISLPPVVLTNTSICNSLDHATEDLDKLAQQPEPYQKCVRCVYEKKGVWTALGCIKTDIGGFVNNFFQIGLGLAGGIALIFIIYSGLLIMMSRGNAEQIQHGREILTSAITGLLLIIFSVFILNLISNDILKIPFKEQNPPIIPRNVIPTVTPAAQTYCCTTSNLAIYQCPFGQNSGTCSIALGDGRTLEGTKCNARCDVIATPVPNTCEQNGGTCKQVCGQGEEQKIGQDWVCNLPKLGSDVDICCKAKTPDNQTLPSANSWSVDLFIDGKEESSISTLNNRSFILEAESQELKAFSGKILTTLSINTNNGSTIVSCKEPTQGPLGEVLIFMNIPQEVTLPTSPFSGQINIFASYNSCPSADNYNSIFTNSSLQKTKDIQFNLN